MGSVSIIIPSYNRCELIGITLNNIFSQTLPPHEVIVVDDGSTDGTPDFIMSNYGLDIKLITTKRQGPGAARNEGLKVATGDYIKFFDSDDLMTVNTLQAQSDLLDKSLKAFVYSPYFYAHAHGDGWIQAEPAILSYHPFSSGKPLHYWMAVKNLFIPLPAMMFRRSLLETVGPWRTDVVASEDWDYLWRMSLIESYPDHVNECAFLYRVHGKQTTVNHFNDRQRDADKIRVLKSIFDKLNVHGSQVSMIEKLVFRNFFYQLSLLAESDANDVRGNLRQYIKFYDPLVWSLIRLDRKIGRNKTGTNWQPCHGPLVSKEKFEEYVNMISIV